MSDMLCQVAQERVSFQGRNAAPMVCPNCRISLAFEDHDVTPAPCRNCQTCLSVYPRGSSPMFPLPYVCRHWLSPSRNSIATSNFHECKRPQKTLRPVSQIDITSPRTAMSGGTIQLNVSPNFSRSNSPETNVVMPDILLSLNGVPVASVMVPTWTEESDSRVLKKAKEDLLTSGWYYGNLSWQKASAILAASKEGTFLVRDSSSSKCPFAISVQTSQGPTSIRIEYERGKFWLDCERKGITPQFDSVMELVTYYKDLASPNTSSSPRNPGKSVWVDHKGRVFSPIKVVQPLFKNISSLKHLCRVALNHSSNSNISSLPSSLQSYLSNYIHKL